MTPMFQLFEEVRHLKTRRVYMIIGIPRNVLIEETGEPAYAYRLACDPSGTIYVRSQTKMEDGRFEPVKD